MRGEGCVGVDCMEISGELIGFPSAVEAALVLWKRNGTAEAVPLQDIKLKSLTCDGRGYQPRVCKSCDSSRAAMASPFIVPVTSSLVSARILGSS